MADITLDKAYEVRHWMRVLACSELQLRQAVKAVGTREEDVRRYLQSSVSPASRWTALTDKAKPGGFTGPGDV